MVKKVSKKAVESGKTAAAFFDLDHTLLSTNCSFSFGKYLYKKGHLSKPLMCMLSGLYFAHKARLLSMMDMQGIIFHKLFKGKPAKVFSHLAFDFLDESLDSMLYRPAVTEMHLASATGSLIAIFSSSPCFLVGPISERLGVEHWEASKYAVDRNGNFSHISRYLEGEGKAEITSQLIARMGINKNDVAAYSDSYHDLPFLEFVGKPVAVQPDRRLKKHSLRNQWRII
jgi:HAD superfamily hydrolase (TIGR01490 family)